MVAASSTATERLNSSGLPHPCRILCEQGGDFYFAASQSSASSRRHRETIFSTLPSFENVILLSLAGGSLLMRSKFLLLLFSALLAVFPAAAQWRHIEPVTSVSKEVDGAKAVFKSGAVLKLQVCSDSMIHVRYSPTANVPNRPDYV